MSRAARPVRGLDLRRLFDDERFVRGLGLGALIGAAIAGSTLWTRLRRPPRGVPEDRQQLRGPQSHEVPPA